MGCLDGKFVELIRYTEVSMGKIMEHLPQWRFEWEVVQVNGPLNGKIPSNSSGGLSSRPRLFTWDWIVSQRSLVVAHFPTY